MKWVLRRTEFEIKAPEVKGQPHEKMKKIFYRSFFQNSILRKLMYFVYVKGL